MASINTNYGAMVAAQSFAAIGRELDKVQNRVTTGLKVTGAKDNGAVWAIATTQKANAKALDSTINNLQRQQSIADVRLAAGETIMAALTELKTLAAAIEAGGTTTAYQADYTALVTELGNARTAGVFDGSAAMTAPATALNAAASATQANVQAVIDGWTTILQTEGTNAKSYERQIVFNTKLQDALTAAAGNLVDADLAKESARLTALQTKQQLGVQALAIANNAPSALLGLFR